MEHTYWEYMGVGFLLSLLALIVIFAIVIVRELLSLSGYTRRILIDIRNYLTVVFVVFPFIGLVFHWLGLWK